MTRKRRFKSTSRLTRSTYGPSSLMLALIMLSNSSLLPLTILQVLLIGLNTSNVHNLIQRSDGTFINQICSHTTHKSIISPTIIRAYLANEVTCILYFRTLILLCSNYKNLSCVSRRSSTGKYYCRNASKNSLHPAGGARGPLDYSQVSYQVTSISCNL